MNKQNVIPQATDIEDVVLGALMTDVTCHDSVLSVYDNPEIFYKPINKTIFKAIKELYQRGKSIDVLTVPEKLKEMGELERVGGAFAVADLTNRVASGANAMSHMAILLQMFVRREVIRLCSVATKSAFDDSCDGVGVTDSLITGLEGLGSGVAKGQLIRVDEIILRALGEIEIARTAKNGVSGVSSGIDSIDRISGGWQKSDLIVIAARPGIGKTSFVLSAARNAAVKGIPTAFFSLEMGDSQLVQRLISVESKIHLSRLRKGQIDDIEYKQITERIDNLRNSPLYVEDTPALSLNQLRGKLRQAVRKFKIELAVVDYLQLMKGDQKGQNREQEISTITRGVKELAKEFKIPIILLSQLNRGVETRGGLKKPHLSDLRESGAIEQDADIVAFLWRPAYYGFLQDEDGKPIPTGYTEFSFAKHRNGATDIAKIVFEAEYTHFTNVESEYIHTETHYEKNEVPF